MERSESPIDEVSTWLFTAYTLDNSCNSKSDTLACLRAADATALQIMNAGINVGAFYGTFTFVPVVDGEFIVERPTETMSKGKMNGVRCICILLEHDSSLSFRNV